ncbi:type 1 glutamine amidotransferase [Psychromicrobium lacuslunae]|uniref:Glutamine amidotransferase domain-containing protein n=1 Tax=Psychromicrobium lacuslunae TaxID=1618207 RepID=A0A0D4BZ84_9MICC|nr:type 1 glutamine amidotransferase [Psychromicrobium lacuslunae]AJT41455.1 hypothetical protein UM93_07875 [Psychromicrobium lacuslunae]
MKSVLILQHVPVEGPGLIAKALDERHIPWQLRNLLEEADPQLPDLQRLAGVVLMGGPMDAGDTTSYPALALEALLVREAIAAELPVLGVCLGHQIIALALGAQIDYAATREIGLGALNAGAELALLDGLEVLHWHTDNVGLPAGATPLASTSECAYQALRYRSALGLQFHLELDQELLQQWLAAGMDQDLEPGQAAALLAEFVRTAAPREAAAAQVFGDFATAVQLVMDN